VVFEYDGKGKEVRSSPLKVVQESTSVPLDKLSNNGAGSVVASSTVVYNLSLFQCYQK